MSRLTERAADVARDSRNLDGEAVIIGELIDEIERLRAALAYYADPAAWTDHVIDSYSGECHFFDWPGDLGDEPYSIAIAALETNDEVT